MNLKKYSLFFIVFMTIGFIFLFDYFPSEVNVKLARKWNSVTDVEWSGVSTKQEALNSRFFRWHVSNSSLNDSIFRGGFFISIKFENVQCIRCDFRGSVADGIVLKNTNFNGANFKGASLSFSKLENVDFRSADLTNSVWIGAKFKNIIYNKETKLADFLLKSPEFLKEWKRVEDVQ